MIRLVCPNCGAQGAGDQSSELGWRSYKGPTIGWMGCDYCGWEGEYSDLRVVGEERCKRCNHLALSFHEFNREVIDYDGYRALGRRVVTTRWCWPCSFDWRALWWKLPPNVFSTAGV